MNTNKIPISLSPCDAMILLSFHEMIVHDIAVSRCKLFVDAIKTYKAEVYNTITPEQIRESEDELELFQILREAGIQ